jgi:hypothetical protein
MTAQEVAALPLQKVAVRYAEGGEWGDHAGAGGDKRGRIYEVADASRIRPGMFAIVDGKPHLASTCRGHYADKLFDMLTDRRKWGAGYVTHLTLGVAYAMCAAVPRQ